MSEVIVKILELPVPFNLATIAVILGIGMAVIAIIAGEVRKHTSHRLDLEAKREMLAQGMTPEEIDRVLRAGKGKDSARAEDA